jgi:3-oxoacyl-(acyl-carrier-protein) synthase
VLCNSFGFGGNDSSLIVSSLQSDNAENNHRLQNSSIRIVSKVEITSEDQLTEIRNYVTPMEARRMGKIMKSSLLSSLKALKDAGIEKPDAIITGTSMGCLENSERLLLQLIEEGEGSLKPTYFMQSTHNTISSNIAIRLGCHGYNVTYTQDEDSLKWAIRDAEMQLRSGKYKTILVGCHDETTHVFSSIMQRLGESEQPSIHSIAMILTCGE